MSSPSRRIGILGGTFDPFHAGHLEAALTAERVLRLTEVLLVPSMIPPHRQDRPQASPCHRFTMVALGVAGHEGLLASDDELRDEGPSYTSVTLERMHAKGFAPTELFFMIGTDAFGEITSWHNYPVVLDAAHFVVVDRPGTSLAMVRARLTELGDRVTDPASLDDPPPPHPRIVLLPADTPDGSATQIRRKVAAGAPLSGLTPPAVIDHIERYGLYQPTGDGPDATDGRQLK